ncbi:cytochrome c maturation protein CcmH [Colwellia sp. KU-HH00111]|uniref:cytochrome c-type biogenesis protein n=1 Tax=Colwellia sp. KU-HH00111 TaxID=3127652 RepID=UPI003105A278
MMFAGKLLNQVLLTVIMMVITLIVTTSLGMSSVQASPVETFEFQDEVTKVRFQALSKELRCPKCQNQNLADSNSTVASALRLDLYNLLIQNKSDAEIVDLMVDRYGEFVLYRPRVSSVTYILWFGPALLILIGIIIVIVILRKKPVSKESLSLNTEQQQKLDQLLTPSDNNVSSSKSASAQKE